MAPGYTEACTASEELCSGSHLFVTKLRLKSKFQKLQPPHLVRPASWGGWEIKPKGQGTVQASEVPF